MRWSICYTWNSLNKFELTNFLYLRDKTCNPKFEFLVPYHKRQRNRWDISYSSRPRSRHRQNKILLKKKTKGLGLVKIVRNIQKFFKSNTVTIDSVKLCSQTKGSKCCLLTLFRPGGGRMCPLWLWTFITFFIRKLNPSSLVTFPKIYLRKIWRNKCLSIKCDVTMATTFWQAIFSEFLIFTFSLKNYNFSEVSFTFLYHFRVLLLISVTFWPILANFKGSETTRNPRWWTQDGRHFRTWCNCTSYDVISLRCGPLIERNICLPSLVVIALIFLKLRGGGRISPPPLVPEDPKKPGLNRVKVFNLLWGASVVKYILSLLIVLENFPCPSAQC